MIIFRHFQANISGQSAKFKNRLGGAICMVMSNGPPPQMTIVHECTVGLNDMKSTRRVLGHSLTPELMGQRILSMN